MNAEVLRSRWVVAGAVVLLLAAVFGIRTWLDKDAPEVGSTVGLSYVSGYGHEVSFRLPGAEVKVEVGSVLDSVPEEPDADEDIEAGRGKAFLPIEWQHSPSPQGRTPGASALDEPAQGHELAVVVDGEKHVVLDEKSAQQETMGRVAVVVPDGTEIGDITLELTFDGLTQVAHPDTGEVEESAAVLLYDPEPPLSAGQGCWPDGEQRRFRMPIECEVGQIDLLPWDPEHGWVEEPGEAWAYVPARVAAPTHYRFVPQDAFYIVGDGEVTALLDGNEPLGEVDPSSVNNGQFTDTTYVFPVSDKPSELEIAGAYPLNPEDGPWPKRTYRFEQRMNLR